jgi:hypothetical protein
MSEFSWETVDTETVLSGHGDWLGSEQLEALSRHPLDCVDTEYPHDVHAVRSPDGVARPSEQHPVFYGCFDWHSAVHGHWCLLRQLRLFDDHPAASDVVDSVDARLTPENVEREVAFFEEHGSFERPYGWGWFLRLVAELHLWDDDPADDWRATLRPLEETLVSRVERDFLSQERPFRVGTHHNTAFALGCVLDYARVAGDDSLAAAASAQSRALFEADRDAPAAYEPLGLDFLSTSLVEADLMRRVLDSGAFASWLDGFLPDVTTPPSNGVLDPVEVASPSGADLHFVGLNLSKAWCLAGIASTLESDGHRYVEPFRRSAGRHAEQGLSQAFTDAYAGAHWLSSFVLYLLTRNDGAVAPG